LQRSATVAVLPLLLVTKCSVQCEFHELLAYIAGHMGKDLLEIFSDSVSSIEGRTRKKFVRHAGDEYS